MTAAATKEQMTLDFEPSLPEAWASLREFLAHRIQVQAKPAKTIAGDMDMSPSLLSHKLAPPDSTSHRFTIDDLETYIRVSKDVTPITYLAAKFLQSDEQRRARAIARVEGLAVDLERALAGLREAGA